MTSMFLNPIVGSLCWTYTGDHFLILEALFPLVFYHCFFFFLTQHSSTSLSDSSPCTGEFHLFFFTFEVIQTLSCTPFLPHVHVFLTNRTRCSGCYVLYTSLLSLRSTCANDYSTFSLGCLQFKWTYSLSNRSHLIKWHCQPLTQIHKQNPGVFLDFFLHLILHTLFINKFNLFYL